MQNNTTFRTMRRFKQQLTEQECETISMITKVL
jgi:hypothetical protein